MKITDGLDVRPGPEEKLPEYVTPNPVLQNSGALQPDLWRLYECRLGQEEKPRRDGFNLRGIPTFIFWEESGDLGSRSPSAMAD